MIRCRIGVGGDISINRNGQFVDMRCPYGGGACNVNCAFCEYRNIVDLTYPHRIWLHCVEKVRGFDFGADELLDERGEDEV